MQPVRPSHSPLVLFLSTTELPVNIITPFSSGIATGSCVHEIRSGLTACPQLMCPHELPNGLYWKNR